MGFATPPKPRASFHPSYTCCVSTPQYRLRPRNHYHLVFSVNDPTLLTRLSAVLTSFSALGLALLFCLQYSAFRRTGRKSLLVLGASTLCALAVMLALTLAPLLIDNSQLLTNLYVIADLAVLLQLTTAVGGSAVLIHHYLELYQAKSLNPTQPTGFLETFGIRPAAAIKVINWCLVALALVTTAIAQFRFHVLDIPATWLYLIPSGFALRALQPSQGLAMRFFGLLLNVLMALAGWAVFAYCLATNPEPIRGCLLSLLLCAAPYSANTAFLLQDLRSQRTGQQE